MPPKLVIGIFFVALCYISVNGSRQRDNKKGRVEHKTSISTHEAKNIFCRMHTIDYIFSARKNFVRAYVRRRVYQEDVRHSRSMQFIMRMEGFEAHSYVILVEEVLRNLYAKVKIASAEFLEKGKHIDIDLYINLNPYQEEEALVTRRIPKGAMEDSDKVLNQYNETRDSIFLSKIKWVHPYRFDKDPNNPRFYFWLFSVRYKGMADALFYFKQTPGSTPIRSFKAYPFKRIDIPDKRYGHHKWRTIPIRNMKPGFDVIGVVQRMGIYYMALKSKEDPFYIKFVAFSMTAKYNITFLDDGTHWQRFFDCEENTVSVRLLYDVYFALFVILSYCACLTISYEESHKSVSVKQVLQKKGWIVATAGATPFIPKRFTQQVSEITWVNQGDKTIHHEYVWTRIKEQFLEIFGEKNFEELEKKLRSAENTLYGVR